MFYKSIHGWFDFEEVYDLAVESVPHQGKGAVFVEVGSWLGKSACYMAQRIKDSGKPITLHCVDNFKGSSDGAPDQRLGKFLRRSKLDASEVFRENIRTGGYDSIVRLIVNESTQASKLFSPFSVDFVFLDAAHDYQNVKEDITAWIQKVKNGGMIGGHDFCALTPGVEKAVSESFGSTFEVKGNSWLVRLE